MEERYTDPQHPKQEKSDIRSRYFFPRELQKLREKYTRPGEDRPDRRYYLIVTLLIILISWWMLSIFLEIIRGNGKFHEGRISFVLMLIERTGLISFFAAALILLKKTSHKKDNWKIFIAAVLLAAAAFFSLRNPIRDIPYLFDPTEVVITNWEMDVDGSARYSTFFKLKGTDAEGQLMIFYINSSTYRDHPFSDEVEELTVEYLPHTEMVMSISAK